MKHFFVTQCHKLVRCGKLALSTSVLQEIRSQSRTRLDFRRSLVSGLRSSPKREECLWGRSAGSFPEQWLVIEPRAGPMCAIFAVSAKPESDRTGPDRTRPDRTGLQTGLQTGSRTGSQIRSQKKKF